VSTHIFIEHLRTAFNKPNSAHDYLLFAFLVLTIAGVCAIIVTHQHKNKNDHDD